MGKNIFIESCPQYFNLNCDKYSTENGGLYLLAPPLRSQVEQNSLKENIDLINTIGTDHCSFFKVEKLESKKVCDTPKGIGSLEYSFSLMYHLYGDDIIDKFTVNPAKIHGLYPKKGSLTIGTDADIAIFDPEKKFVVRSGNSKSDYSVYEGMELKGQVESTILRGKFVIKNGEFFEQQGQFLKRKL